VTFLKSLRYKLDFYNNNDIISLLNRWDGEVILLLIYRKLECWDLILKDKMNNTIEFLFELSKIERLIAVKK